MKKYRVLLISLVFLMGCQDFQELNRDPNVVDSPNLETLLTYVEKRLADYKGPEWFYDNHQIMPWAQYLVNGEGNASDINFLEPRGGKYVVFFTDIVPHLLEIRRQIEEKTPEEQEFYQKLTAVTYIIQVYHALKVTDIFGSIPYEEAGKGRYEGMLDPVYDNQQTLFNTFHQQLNTAIADLSEVQERQFEIGTADFIYDGDYDRWIKLANALKMRLALRLESRDLAKAQTIISEVMGNGNIMGSMDDQFTYYISDNWWGTGGATMDWKGVLWAAKPMVDFMKENLDPRLRIYYEPNGYHQATLDAYGPGDAFPAVIDTVNDNAVLYTAADGEEMLGYRYIGVPVSRFDPALADYNYIYNLNNVGRNAIQVSKYQQRLLINTRFNYGQGNGTGAYIDVLLSHAEVCFMMAEFILKGYAQGDAEAWYQQGIRSSVETYDWIAQKGQFNIRIASKPYPYVPVSQSEIDVFLAQPDIALDGANDLEKVYIQQFFNFYRLPEEGWILAMRSGYPSYTSSIFARGYVDNPEIPFPRRMPTPDPGDLNRANWNAALQEQGISSGYDESPPVLNSERLWWDENNPEIGSGD
jgi:hypothetical protein